MARFSTGLRNKMLDANPFRTVMALGNIKIYSGAEPATADAAVTGTLLTTITVASGATGLSFAAAAVNGVIAKAVETWSGTNAASGAATFYRHVAVGDDGLLSTTQARIQGNIAVAGADLNISNVNLVAAATQTIDSYNVALPTL